MSARNRSGVLRRCRDDDDGFAIVTVLGAMFVLTAIVLAALGYALSSMPQARRSQDWGAALGAAQAGVDDYRRHLNDNDTYWTKGNVDNDASGNPLNKAFTQRVSVPGTPAGGATYTYRLLTTVNTTASTGLIRVKVTGQSRAAKRTIVANIRKTGFLNYVYFTDKETIDPAIVANLRNESYAAWSTKCNKYYYTGRSDCYDTYFGDSDVINGPLHTNDAMMLGGQPTFTSPQTETSWADDATPAPPASGRYRQQYAGSKPNNKGYAPVYAGPLLMPPTNSEIKTQTDPGTTGCLYTGPTRIVLESNGKMLVTSPYTKSVNAGCSTSLPMTTAQEVILPVNGVVYVQGIPAATGDPNHTDTCTPGTLGYPQAGDITPYNCNDGNVFLEGTLSGQLTIAVGNDIIPTGDVLYNTGVTGTDVLGLVANNYVTVYHPVNSSGQNLGVASAGGQPMQNIEIDAAILSVNHCFTVQNWNRGAPLGARHVVGTTAAAFSPISALGDSNGIVSGYNDKFDYDRRLLALPPPYFLKPTAAPWLTSSVSEQTPS